MFDRQRDALAVSGTAWLPMEGARNLPDGDVFKFLETDFTGENLAVFLSPAPGLATVAQLDVTFTVETSTWGDELTPCKDERRLPCDAELTDEIPVTILSVDWDETSFTSVPEAEVPNDVVPLYLELRRIDGTGPRHAGGVFYLTETNLNGDT